MSRRPTDLTPENIAAINDFLDRFARAPLLEIAKGLLPDRKASSAHATLCCFRVVFGALGVAVHRQERELRSVKNRNLTEAEWAAIQKMRTGDKA